MFDKYHGVLHIEEILKKEYQYEFNGDLQDLYEKFFIELEGDGVTALFWICVENENYLFKPLENPSFNIWGELLSCEFAKMLEIPCAEYRVASFNGKYGVLSKRMNNAQETLILGCEIFQEFLNSYQSKYNNTPLLINEKFLNLYQIPKEFYHYDAYQQKRYLFNHLNNLTQVHSILTQRADINEKDLSNILIQLDQMLLFDLFTLQMDRHPNNWGLTKTSKTIKLSPLFDNSTSFGLGYPQISERANLLQNEIMSAHFFKDSSRINTILYQSSPNFTLSPFNMVDIENRKKDISPKVLNDYLELKGIEGYKLVEQFLNVMTEENLDISIIRSERTNGIKMDEFTSSYIHNCFEKNIENLQDTFKAVSKRKCK